MKFTPDCTSYTRRGRTGFVRAAWLVLGCLGFVLPAGAQIGSVDSDASRERIAIERRQADALLAARRWECSHRFAVTACMNEARAAHRDALERLGREEEALNSQLRHARAAKRLEIIRQKTEAQARLSAATAAQPSPQRQSDVQRPTGPSSAPGPSSSSGDKERAAADRAAAQRAAATQQRLDEAARQRARREAQQAERKNPAAALPAYPSIPPARASSAPN